MAKKKVNKTSPLLFLTLALLLLIPLAITGLNQNVLDIRNYAETAKLSYQDDFLTSNVDTVEVITNQPFRVQLTNSTSNSIAPQYLAWAVYLDRNLININQDPELSSNLKLVKVIKTDQTVLYLITSKNFIQPTEQALTQEMFKEIEHSTLNPKNCYNRVCPIQDDVDLSNTQASFNLTLTKEITSNQRPIKVYNFAYTSQNKKIVYDYNQSLVKLPLKAYKENTTPTFTSTPSKSAWVGQEYSYEISAVDKENDNLAYSLLCPEYLLCQKSSDNPAGLTFEGRTLVWENPVASKDPYKVTVYVSDGQSVSQQSFNLKVHDSQEQAGPVCQLFKTQHDLKLLPIDEPTSFILKGTSYYGFKSIKVDFIKLDGANEQVAKTLNYSYPKGPKEVFLDKNSQPPLQYQFSEGQYKVKATLTDQESNKTECYANQDLTAGQTINLPSRIVRFFNKLIKPVKAQAGILQAGPNSPPNITSNPYQDSEPSANININQNYSYNLAAQDPDEDTIEIILVTKPNWATYNVNCQNQNCSSLVAAINGKPTQAGSYTFSFSLWDGIQSHYVTQTWIVNVNDPNNDTPRVTFSKPVANTSFKQGNKLTISWDIQDNNPVHTQKLYYTKNSDGRTNLKVIDDKLKYSVRTYIWNTKNVSPGKYYIVLTATDTYNPPATGRGISNQFTVEVNPALEDGKSGQKSDVSPVQSEKNPLILNEKPEDGSSITEFTPQISVTILSSKNAKLDKNKVKLFLDETDITKNADFTGHNKIEGNLVYFPEADLELGTHQVKVIVTDSKKRSAEKTWSFTITEGAEFEQIEETETSADQQTVTILGFRIPKSLLYPILIGLLILLSALLLPFLLYLSSRGNRPKTYKASSDLDKPKEPIGPISTPPRPSSPSPSADSTIYPTVPPPTKQPEEPITPPTKSATDYPESSLPSSQEIGPAKPKEVSPTKVEVSKPDSPSVSLTNNQVPPTISSEGQTATPSSTQTSPTPPGTVSGPIDLNNPDEVQTLYQKLKDSTPKDTSSD